VGSGAQTPPAIAAAESQGPAGLTGMYTELTKAVTTQTYANAFYVVALMCAGGVLLGLTMRSGKARNSGVKAHVEV
jgi:hypothetical protein